MLITDVEYPHIELERSVLELAGFGMELTQLAPHGSVKFIPTGGINQDNLADYLAQPSVHRCGGSWLVKAKLISAGAFDEITRMTQEAMAIVRQHRGQGGGQ